MKKLLILLAFIISTNVKAQTDSISIKTSAVCETCKETIERDLSFVRGIISSSLDLKTHQLSVVYDSKKIDADKIRNEVAKIGYNADSVKADPKAFKRLPECCKKPHNE
ncbi:MAG: cation transporter [Bacteroidetes bacterium]|nr:cation transporter [Bacteroidota bacterium]